MRKASSAADNSEIGFGSWKLRGSCNFNVDIGGWVQGQELEVD